MKEHYPKLFNFEAHPQQVGKTNELRQLSYKPRKPGVCISNKNSADNLYKVS